MSEKQKPAVTEKTAAARAEREARLAARLRDNLKRRKAPGQMSAQATAEPAPKEKD